MTSKQKHSVSEPETVRLSSQRLDQISRTSERHIHPEGLAGTVSLVARAGQIAYFESCGQLSREGGQAMPLDAIFQIYSMTKPIVCTAMMLLVERGLIRLNDPVSNYIPKFKELMVYVGGSRERMVYTDLERPVTVRDLFTHTSGLTYHFAEYGPVEMLYRERSLPEAWNLEQFVDGLLDLPLAFQPGERWRYSLGHDVLGRLIEIISGERLDQFLEREIFGPLEMIDTAYYVPESKWERFASMYGSLPIEGQTVTASQWYGDLKIGVRLIQEPKDFRYHAPHPSLRGGTGLTSTTLDYWRFCQMLLNDGLHDGQQLLSRKSIALMRSNHLPAELLPYESGGVYSPGYGFGLGMRVMMDVGESGSLGSVGEYGWGGAASTYFLIDPVEDLIAIFMTQFQPSGHYPTSEDFRTSVYQAVL